MIAALAFGTITAVAVGKTAALAQSPPASATAPAAAAPAAAPAAAASPEDAAKQKRFEACRDDLKTYCASVEKGGGRKVKCLKENEAKLSASCKATLADIEKDREQRKADKAAGKAAATPAPAAPATK